MKIKSIVCSLLLCLSAALTHAQSTTVTGTIVDSTSTVWKGATISALFRPTPGIPGPYVWSGGAYNPQPAPITADSSGHFSISLPSNANIIPAQSQWIFTVCPNATFQCSIVTTAVGGGTMDISAAIAANVSTTTVISLAVPKFYNPADVKPPPLNQGMLGFNTTMNYYQVWDGTLWETICTVQNALCGGGGSGPTIEVNGTPTTSQSVINFVNAGGVTWTNPSAGIIEAAAAGGGSGCTLTSVPAGAIIYTLDGTTCTGSADFVYQTGGTPDVDLNSGTYLYIEGIHDSGANNNNWVITGDNLVLQQDGADSSNDPGVGITLNIQDNHQTTIENLLGLDILLETTKTNKNQSGVTCEPAVTGTSAGEIVCFSMDGTDFNGGATAFNVYGILASTSWGNQATNEETPFLVETVPTASINSNYCDFIARSLGPTDLHESLGCGQSHTSTFNGPVIIEGPTPNWQQIGTNLFTDLPTCNGGQEGTIAPVTDSTTNTWGATVTGSGTDHIAAYCDGTNWTVYAK